MTTTTSDEQDEFETEKQRQKAYGEACDKLAEEIEVMRDKHGDIR